MKKKLVTGWLILCCIICGLSLFSCTSKEPSFEQVDDSFDSEVYFVSGRVSYNKLALEGVDVSIDEVNKEIKTNVDGSYQLYLNGKGTYTLRFEKEGFIKIATSVSLDEATANRSSVVVSPNMTKMNEGIKVLPDDVVEISDPTGKTTLCLLRSLAEETNVGLTVYKELPDSYSMGNLLPTVSKGAEYATVIVEPVDTKLINTGTLLVNKETSDLITFSSVDLYQKTVDDVWEKGNETSFNKDRNAYETEITKFSTYSLRVPYSVEIGNEVVSTHLNGKVKVDNCGNIDAKDNVEIEVQQRCGWDFVTDIQAILSSSLSGISQADKDALSSLLEDQIISLEGTSPGYYDIPVVLSSVNVSGNAVMSYENYAKEVDVLYSFGVIYSGQSYTVPIAIKKYTGMEEIYLNTSCFQHSGGQGK